MVLVLSLLFNFNVAIAYDCPPYVESDPRADITYQWLSKFKDVKELHGCRLEIIVCEKTDTVDVSAPVGEILVTDVEGREGYLAIDFPEIDKKYIHTRVLKNKRMYNYKKKDRFFEKENGRTEVWHLEMVTDWHNVDLLKSLDLGIYATNKQLNQPNGNDSRWYNCN